ncbi:MAG: hypothetical protein AAFZ07_03980 [Actinomycetota bacterium]
MTAFAILFMFMVGVGIGIAGTAFYFQIFTPERARSLLTLFDTVRTMEDLVHSGEEAQASMRDTTEGADSSPGDTPKTEP